MTKEYGLDLSYHNGTVDFSKVKADNSFVILRCGYGVNGTKDSKFEDYYKDAKAQGLNVGAYYYSYALTEANAKSEAENCLDFIKGKSFEMPIFIDMEDADSYKSKNGMPSNSTLVKIVKKFCDTLEDNGYFAGVYASESWFNSQLKNLGDDYTKWVAKWGSNNGKLSDDVSGTYNLHQFTSKYSLNGKTYDRNVMYYDYPNAIKKAGLNGLNSSSSTSSSSSSSSSKSSAALDVDGSIGPNTVKRWQNVMGTTEDSKISGQSSSNKKYWTAISSSVCSWTGGTSKLVKAWQNYLIAKGYSCGTSGADGLLGTNTAKASQKYLIKKGYSCGSAGADGKFGTNSAKALQKWLNDQK